VSKGSKAWWPVDAGLGRQYVIGLKGCGTAETEECWRRAEQGRAREEVLRAMDDAAVAMRSKLG